MANDNTNLYVIWDKVADRISPVFEAVNDKVAIRSFKDSLGSKLEQYSEDYELIRIGYVDRDNQCVIAETEILLIDVDVTDKERILKLNREVKSHE